MKSLRVVLTFVCALSGAASAYAQGRGGGGAWTTTGGDAQRTASVRADPKITKESVAKEFQLLWKRTLDNPSKQLNALTQPVLLPNIISYKGFKALAFIGGAADNVYAIDYDLSRVFWQRHLETGAAKSAPSAECPGLTTMTRATPVSQQPGGGRGGRGQPPGAGTTPAAAAAGVPRAPGAAARGGAPDPRLDAAGRGAAPPPPPEPPAPPMPGSGPGPNAVLGGVSVRFGGNNNVYAISSGGKLHALNPQDGTDMVPPIPFLPANARAVGSILLDTVLYAATTGNCGGAPNGVWAIELAGDVYTVTKHETKDTIAGDGPAFAPDGTVYAAAGKEVVALAPKTLEIKARFAEGKRPFTSSPVVFASKGKTFVVAGTDEALISLADEGSRFVSGSTPVVGGGGRITGIATVDEGSTRWVFASVAGPLQSSIPASNGAVTRGSVVGLKAVDSNGSLTLQPVWASRDLGVPVTPLVVNGVVFALASGEARTDRDRRTSAVLSALDASTGKELWNSGSAIAGVVHGVAPSGGDSQVYVVTTDGTVYAFGIPAER